MKKDPILLLLESSTKVCSVAIAKGKTILAVEETLEGNKHSEWMTIYIERVVAKASLSMQDIDAIAVSAGPGSYTGLRVAYSVAKGLSFSLNVPMIEVDTLTSLADGFLNIENSISSNDVVIPMIDARRMEVYLKLINPLDRLSTKTQAYILDEDSVEKLVGTYSNIYCIGDGAFKIKDVKLRDELSDKIHVANTYCSAVHLLSQAFEKYTSKNWSDVAYCTPFYLKSPNITKSKKNLLA